MPCPRSIAALFPGLVGFFCLVCPFWPQPAGAQTPASPWLLPTQPDAPPRWGHTQGLSISLAPTPGPRGLIRIHAPYLDQPFPRVINFVSLEPVANGRRSQSELERSADGKPGLRFTSGNSLEAALAGSVESPASGVVEGKHPGEKLHLWIASEKMANGARPVVEVVFDANAPHSVTFHTHAVTGSAPMHSLVLSATMGNYARLRRVYLKSGVKHARDLWGDYKPDPLNFAPWRGWGLKDLIQTEEQGKNLARIAFEGDEADPTLATYQPGVARHWRYQGKKATQVWETQAVPGLAARVNARKTYWGESGPIPGGLSFENCEMEAPFQPGASFRLTISPLAPAELGFTYPAK